MGEDEINLVRKKLKWPHLPFEIPTEILNEWRRIGAKGEILERDWLNDLNKSTSKIKENFNNLNNTILRDKLSELVVSEKEKYFKRSQLWLQGNAP